ncbi:MAG: hypothetical protein B5M52_06985 [Helicobacteraceae bacterium 4484_230]|nr:MAG: hypothetical protein B5M52_06985 [Helicobacteraceae bacterium 4484_230]
MHSISKFRNFLMLFIMTAFFSAVHVQAAVNHDNPAALVERCYQNILGKTIKPGPLAHWLRVSDESSAKEVVLGFFSTREYNVLKLTDVQFIEIMYRTLFDRDAAETEETARQALHMSVQAHRQALHMSVQAHRQALHMSVQAHRRQHRHVKAVRPVMKEK